MIADIKIPDSSIVRQAEELVRAKSAPWLYNHVMRCYWFSELFARAEGLKIDRELMFLSSVMHDIGLTDHGRGAHRFEIDGAIAARTFLIDNAVPPERAQGVFDNIALHTWDINLFRDDTSRLTEFGIVHDVAGLPGETLDPIDVAEVLRRYPRLNFKHQFNAALERDLDSKQPYPHWFHPCTRIEHNRAPMQIEDMVTLMAKAPFAE